MDSMIAVASDKEVGAGVTRKQRRNYRSLVANLQPQQGSDGQGIGQPDYRNATVPAGQFDAEESQQGEAGKADEAGDQALAVGKGQAPEQCVTRWKTCDNGISS